MQQISGFNYFTQAMLVMEGIPTITVGESIPTRLVVKVFPLGLWERHTIFNLTSPFQTKKKSN